MIITGGNSGTYPQAKTIAASGGQSGFIVNGGKPSSPGRTDSSQFNFEVHGTGNGLFAIQGTQTTNPGIPGFAEGVCLYFDGTNVYAIRGSDGQTSKLTASWA